MSHERKYKGRVNANDAIETRARSSFHWKIYSKIWLRVDVCMLKWTVSLQWIANTPNKIDFCLPFNFALYNLKSPVYRILCGLQQRDAANVCYALNIHYKEMPEIVR